MANTFAFAESRGGELRSVAFEAVTAARQAADATGGGASGSLIRISNPCSTCCNSRVIEFDRTAPEASVQISYKDETVIL